MSNLRRLRISPWQGAAAWVLTLIPLGVAISAQYDMVLFLSMITLTDALNVMLVASVAYLDWLNAK